MPKNSKKYNSAQDAFNRSVKRLTALGKTNFSDSDKEIERIKKEKKSKHFSFVMRPSTYDAVQEKCYAMDISMAWLINGFLEEFIEE